MRLLPLARIGPQKDSDEETKLGTCQLFIKATRRKSGIDLVREVSNGLAVSKSGRTVPRIGAGDSRATGNPPEKRSAIESYVA